MADFETSHTFDTDAEARAFMLGMAIASWDSIQCEIDTQEPNTILIDIDENTDDNPEEAYKYCLEQLIEYREESEAIAAEERPA